MHGRYTEHEKHFSVQFVQRNGQSVAQGHCLTQPSRVPACNPLHRDFVERKVLGVSYEVV
jgi:hypothetical protein